MPPEFKMERRQVMLVEVKRYIKAITIIMQVSH